MVRNTSLQKILISAVMLVLLALCAAFSATFAYADGENYWTESPDIVRWTYGGFNKVTNVIKGKPAHGTPTFSILHHDMSYINGAEALKDFTVNENGEVSDEVEAELRKLPVAGKGYVLRANAASEGYPTLSTDVPFDVIQASNNWLVPPAVLGWRHGEYDPEINFINAVPAFGKDTMIFILYAKDFEGNFKIHYFNGSQPFFSFKEDGTLPENIKMELKKLDAGTYSLVATVPATANYTGLNTDPASGSTGAIFNISKSVNTWLKSPSVVQWEWSRFNGTINLFTAVPALPVEPAKKRVKFGIYTEADCNEISAVEGLSEFTTKSGLASGDDGVDTRTEDLLRALDAGTYYLLAETVDNPSEITNFAGLRTVVPFTVHKYRNSWKTMPNVVQWNYGEYNPEVNTITAVPHFPVGGAEVRYNIFKEDGYTFAFEQSADGFVIDGEIEEKLSSLGAGNYYLSASTVGNRNYMGMKTVVPFKVQRVQNTWLRTPAVTEWQYGGYDRAFNKITALPAYGDAVIALYDMDGNAVVEGFTLTESEGGQYVPDAVAEKLKGLGAGSYYLYASVAGDDPNFTGLNAAVGFEEIKLQSIKFTVFRAKNGWVTVPRILSWSEGNFDPEENKIIAEAEEGNDALYIYVLDGADKILTSNSGGSSLDYGLISKLSVGSYKVRFEIAETDDYDGLKAEITFAVYEDSVGLGGIIAATVVFAAVDVIAAGVCIALLILRRRKVEKAFREMMQKELNDK